MRTLLAVVVATLLGSPGCTRSEDSSPPDASVTLLSDRAQIRMIGAAGGTLEAVGPDGRALVLEIPPGAILDPTQITLTPAVVSNVGDTIAAAHFAPDGLTLLAAAALRVAAPPDEVTFASGFSGRSAPFHRLPFREVDGEVVVPVHHFSGVVVSGGSISGLATPANLQEQALEQLAEAGDADAIADALEVWWSGIVRPELIDAETDEAKIESAIASYVKWLGEVANFGAWEALEAERIEGRDRAVTGLTHAFDVANAACLATKDPVQVLPALSLFTLATLTGIVDTTDLDEDAFFEALCVKLAISNIEAPASFAGQDTADIQVLASLVIDGQTIDSGPLHVALSCGTQSCSVSPDEGLTDDGGLTASVSLFSQADSANVSAIVSWPLDPRIWDDLTIFIPKGVDPPPPPVDCTFAGRDEARASAYAKASGAEEQVTDDGAGGPVAASAGGLTGTADYLSVSASAPVGPGGGSSGRAGSVVLIVPEDPSLMGTEGTLRYRVRLESTRNPGAGYANVEGEGPCFGRSSDFEGVVECPFTLGRPERLEIAVYVDVSTEGSASATLDWLGIEGVFDAAGQSIAHTFCDGGVGY